MAGKKKLGQILIKLVSQAGTGYFYVTKKNPRNVPYKLQRIKYDPVVSRHVSLRGQDQVTDVATSPTPVGPAAAPAGL